MSSEVERMKRKLSKAAARRLAYLKMKPEYDPAAAEFHWFDNMLRATEAQGLESHSPAPKQTTLVDSRR
jgi:hypothetical protein